MADATNFVEECESAHSYYYVLVGAGWKEMSAESKLLVAEALLKRTVANYKHMDAVTDECCIEWNIGEWED